MMFTPRMRAKPLAGLCRRLAMALLAGVDARTILAREAQQARGFATRQHLAALSLAANRGESLADSLTAAGDFFPALLCEMVAVGEQSGHLGEIFAQLADHYEHQVQLRRNFMGAIAWPMFQLGIALAVVGLLIWVTGFIGNLTGTTIDILGFGLVGDRGLAIYLTMVAVAGTVIWLAIRAASRGLVWTRPIQRGVLALPVLGPALQTLCLARLAWSMYQTMNAGMELRRSLRLSLRSTGNARYTDQIGPIDAEIGRGNTIYEAFHGAGGFPADFLDALDVGERSGKLVESMARLSEQYQAQARAALATLTAVAGFGVWAVVAGLIIVLIFRLFGFYLGAINQALPK